MEYRIRKPIFENKNVIEDCVGDEKSFVIPDGVESVSFSAFKECKYLRRLVIPAGVSSIYIGSFRGYSGIDELVIAEDNEHFCAEDGILYNKEKTAVLGCYGEVELGHGVRSIGKEAFSECINLRDITIPENVTEIGERAFSHIPNLTIRGKKGTITERYAKENGIAFEVI